MNPKNIDNICSQEIIQENDQNQTALIQAIRMNDIKTVKVFINSGVTTDHKCYPDNNGPLHLAAMGEHIELLKVLLEAGCDMYAQNKEKETPLEIIIKKGNVEAAKIFLDAGASRDHTYYVGSFGPLHMACCSEEQNPKMVKLFIDTGYEVSAADEDGNTPLHGAIDSCEEYNEEHNCFFYDTSIVKLLVDAGADVNKKNEIGETSLYLATNSSLCDVVDILLKAGADPNAVNEEYSMLDNVCNFFVARQLIGAGIDVNKVDDKGQLYSIQAAFITYSDVDLLTLYVKHGAKINTVDCNDMDILCQFLVYSGYKQKRKDDVDYEWSFDKNQLSDWDEVIEDRLDENELENQIKCIEVLCKHGFNINRVMNNAYTLLCVALHEYSHSKIIRALLSNGLIVDFDKFNVKKIMEPAKYNSKHQDILIKHAAKCILFRNGEGIVNFDLKKLNKKQVSKYQNCTNELKKLKEFIVYEGMSLFNLIEGPVTSRYILNENLIQFFKTGSIEKSFPMFKGMMVERFQVEHKKYELMSNATAVLKRIIKFNEHSCYDLVYDNILKYFDDDDMKKLVSLVSTKTSKSTDQL